MFYFQWLFRWCKKTLKIIIIIITIYKGTPKEKNVLHCIALSVQCCTQAQTHTCMVDSSFVGFFIDAIFIFMIRLLSQPDFYRILINFISIFIRLYRCELWPVFILLLFLALTTCSRRCILLFPIDKSFSHRFTSFHHKILLFNLRKKNHFADENILKKYKHMCNVRCTNAKETEKKKQKTGVESFYFISINVHAV